MPLLTPCLLVAALLTGQGSREPHYAREYRRAFPGEPGPGGELKIYPHDADPFVRFEPEGVRITLPKGFAGERPFVGVEAPVGVRGDFEITLTYEILHEPAQVDAGKQTKLSLGLTVTRPAPAQQLAALSRMMTEKHGPIFTAWSRVWDEGKKRNIEPFLQAPAAMAPGRLRLVRTGPELAQYRSDGPKAPFALLRADPFGAEDITTVWVMTSTGGSNASLDVRVTDLYIRAASLVPDVPAAATPADESAAAPERGAARWLAVALAILALVGIAAVLRRMQRRATV